MILLALAYLATAAIWLAFRNRSARKRAERYIMAAIEHQRIDAAEIRTGTKDLTQARASLELLRATVRDAVGKASGVRMH